MKLIPRERVLTALHLEEPEVIPIFELAINAPACKEILGRPIRVGSYLVFEAKDYYNVYRGFGLDGMTLWDVGLPMKHLDRETYIDDWSRVWKRSEYSQVTYYIRGKIDRPEDFEEFSPPDPFDPKRLDCLERILQMNRGGLAIVGGIHDAYEIPSMMRGVSSFLLDLYKNPSFAKEVIETSTEYNVELAKAMIDLGVDAIMSGDDYANNQGPLMCPKHFKEFVVPYLKKIVNVSHQGGVPFIKHTDGYLWPILDDIVDTGIDALHPIEPQARMRLKDVKGKYGDAICVMGNVDVAYVLPLGTVRETENEVRRCIREAASGGGYILSSSNSIHDGVKVENFRAMVNAARKYGKYPIR